MRADCEVRVGTASAGMSRLARLVLLQRKGLCVGERVHLRIEILRQMSKGYPFVCMWRGGQILQWLVLSVKECKGAHHTRHPKLQHLREIEVLGR